MAVPSTRTVLSVPFEEKDQAKKLGARWDPQNKHWWVPSNVDQGPFIIWLPTPSAELPIYRDLAAICTEDVEEVDSKWELEVIFVPWDCWKCKQQTLVFHGCADRGICVTQLLYQAKVLDRLDAIRKELNQERFGCVKPRFSRTLNASYVSQGCRHCDALIGEFPLSEDFSVILTEVDLSTYPLCKRLDWFLLKPHR